MSLRDPNQPAVLLVLRGKRKSGKDYVANRIRYILGKETCDILHISEPLKAQFAKENNLDFHRLLDSTAYKEIYRSEMIKWGEQVRFKDPDYFCRLATTRNDSGPVAQVWIVCDTRRKSDLEYFIGTFKRSVLTVSVVASEKNRESRAYVFVPGIDDSESECGLDDYHHWDFVIRNDAGDVDLDEALAPLLGEMRRRISEDPVLL